MNVPDELVLLPMLLGLAYVVFVKIAETFLLVELWPRVFGPRARPMAVATVLFGIGLSFAGVKYDQFDDPAAKFYMISGWSLIVLGAWLWLRRNRL